MQRLLVVLLAAFDAVIVVATGVAVVLAPLTLLWVFGIGDPPWGALWPASGTIWQLGHFVPLSIALPTDYLADAGIDAAAASFTLSLAPGAFAAFTAIFAARSGGRAARAGAWLTGVGTGTVVVAALSALIALTCGTPIASVPLWQAVLFPTLVFAVPALAGALVGAWRDGDDALVDLVHDRVDALPGAWASVPALIARGSAIAVTGLLGAGALAVAVAVVLRGGEVIALFEAGHVDLLGATVITLGQLAYIPTLVVWSASFLAGPGFALGVGTAVSPAGTQLGVVPAVPLLGIVPPASSPWLLVLVVVPILIGGIAGWAARARVAAPAEKADAAPAAAVHPALAGLLGKTSVAPEPTVTAPPAAHPVGALSVTALGIAVVAGSVMALLAFLASGSVGPDRLAEVGPPPGPVALAVGVEVFVGAAIALLTTRRAAPARRSPADGARKEAAPRPPEPSEPSPEDPARPHEDSPSPLAASGALLDELRTRMLPSSPAPGAASHDTAGGADSVTAPIELPDPSTLGRHRPAPLPPVD